MNSFEFSVKIDESRSAPGQPMGYIGHVTITRSNGVSTVSAWGDSRVRILAEVFNVLSDEYVNQE